MNFSTSILAPEKPINVSPRNSDSFDRASEAAYREHEITDEDLISRYRENGDRAIYETLMRRYEREIYAYLRRYMGNAELAEDAFQGTFLQVHLKCQQFDLTRRFRPWLYAIATNQAIDVQRRNKRHRMVSLDRPSGWQDDDRGGSWSEKLVGASADPLAEAAREESGRWVHEAVEQLGKPMQQVVELVYYRGLKYREAADALGIPVGTVKSRLHSAIHQLGGLWDDSHDSE